MKTDPMKDSVEIYYAVTTNRLRDGATVYLTKSEKAIGWSTDIAQAVIITESVRERMLRLAQADVEANIVLDPYAIEITDNHKPLGTRERIRAAGGPTIKFGTDDMAKEGSDYVI